MYDNCSLSRKMEEFGKAIGLQWPEQLMTMRIMLMMILIFSDKQSFSLHPLFFAHCQITH